MKKALLILTALASLTIANYSARADDKSFFAGAHLGMFINQCEAYYKNSRQDVGALEHSGPPPREAQVDFRTSSIPQRRVYVYFTKADRKIVSVLYWKLAENETFSSAEIQFLININREQGPLITKIVEEGSGFLVTTPRQYQIEQALDDY